MKNKLLSIAFVAAIAVAGGWNFIQSENRVELLDLTLENVEALADGESGLPGYADVYMSWVGPFGNTTLQKVCANPGSKIC